MKQFEKCGNLKDLCIMNLCYVFCVIQYLTYNLLLFFKTVLTFWSYTYHIHG